MNEEVISQYRASLKMLIDVIKKCPDDLWLNDKDYVNGYSRIVYHTIFYTSLHLTPAGEKFIRWKNHIDNYNYLEPISPVDNKPIIIEKFFSKEEMIEYSETVLALFEISIDVDSDEGKSSYEWMKKSRVWHIYNIRHMQHHIGQLIERLHNIGIKGIEWEE